MTDLPAIIAGLSEAVKRAILTAEPRRRALDPDSRFICNSRGIEPGELKPFTLVTLAGLMLNDTGLAIKQALERGE